MAALMVVVALAIDAVLPALDIIGEAIGTTQIVDNQLIITMIFLGLGLGPLVFGPLSDSLGRKPTVYMGFGLFIIASVVCVYAKSLEVMIAGRILQGVALSAPRTMAIAIIRDKFSGDYMARIMSFVTVVFILVPIVAPAIGAGILEFYDWKGIFYMQLIVGVFVTLWFWKRQEETLNPMHKKSFKLEVFANGFKEVFNHKLTMGYTIIAGFITGSFMVYLSSSQQIFKNQYDMEAQFPYIFAGLALTIGISILLNGTFVLRFGMRRLVNWSLIGFFLCSATYLVLFHDGVNPSAAVLLTFFAIQFFFIGFMFGNLRALAMQPVGYIAGIAAAITGFISTIMAVPISTYIGRFIDGSALPLFIGFTLCAALSLPILWYMNKLQKAPEID